MGSRALKARSKGKPLVTTEKLSHLFNAIGSDGVIRHERSPADGPELCRQDHCFMIPTFFPRGGAWGLYFKCKITGKGPKALICRTVHPISVGGAVDAEIPGGRRF